MSEENPEKSSSKANIAFIIFFIILIILIFLYYWLPHPLREQPPRFVCASKLKQINLALYMYADDYSGVYPTPEKWCDLIVPYLGQKIDDIDKKMFCCPGAKDGKCHYAINPNCEPNSPHDIVLLFETKGGWNQFGGHELLTTENHEEVACNIGFNDGSVSFIKEEEIKDLKWSDD